MIIHIYKNLLTLVFSCWLSFHCYTQGADPNVEASYVEPNAAASAETGQNAWDRKSITPNDRMVYENSLWSFANYPSVRIPVLRAPFPTFGMVMPLPYWWSGTEHFYPVDVAKLDFVLTGADNYILKSAISRCKQIITDRTGLSVYANHWIHQESSLSAMATEYQTSKHGSTRLAGTAGAASDNAERPTFRWSEKRVQWIYELFKFPQLVTSSAPLRRVRIHVRSSGKDWPSLDMDESYALLVDKEQIYLVANETWGALRGLESLNQLMWRTSDKTQVYINQTYMFDKPRFPHRGLLVDTSRHFISKSIMLVNLEAMAFNKMNVLHWHIVDDNSYPYQSKTFPTLSQKGAWTKRQVYTPSDIKEIVEFARLRGIRVIPEFDIPGHTRSLAYSRPELLAQCQTQDDKTVYFGPLNPFINETYQFIEDLINELFNLFPDEYIHLGGDEVEPYCWDADLQMVKAQAKLNLRNIPTIEYFWKRVQNIITEIGNRQPENRRKVIVWQEVTTQVLELKSSVVSQVWKPDVPPDYSLPDSVLFSSCWYLDLLHSVRNWAPYYLCEPVSQLNLQSESGPITLLGGEACMWAEYQSDDTILQKIWPVTSGIAERLWSPHWVKNITTVGPRIEEQRCRMISRGIPQSVLLGPGSCEYSGAITAMADAVSSGASEVRNLRLLLNEQKLGELNTVEYKSVPVFLIVACFFLLSAMLVIAIYKFSLVGTNQTRSLAFCPRRLSATRILCLFLLLAFFIYGYLAYVNQRHAGV